MDVTGGGVASTGPAQQVAGSTALAADTSTASWAAGSWWQQLQPASWRGVRFFLDAGDTRAGRRVALHEYPYRDDAWAEDLGKLPRRFAIQGWLDLAHDVYQQRNAIIAACEQPGPGTLVHPTLGSVQCVLLEFATMDRRERGRFVEISLSFIIAGSVLYPSTALATGQAVTGACANLNAASARDLATALPAAAPPGAAAGVQSFTGQAVASVHDPALIFGAVAGLQGVYGRFSVGNRSTLLPPDMTASLALAAATTARTAVTVAASALGPRGGRPMTTQSDAFAAAAVNSRAAQPPPTIPPMPSRLLLPLAGWQPPPIRGRKRAIAARKRVLPPRRSRATSDAPRAPRWGPLHRLTIRRAIRTRRRRGSPCAPPWIPRRRPAPTPDGTRAIRRSETSGPPSRSTLRCAGLTSRGW